MTRFSTGEPLEEKIDIHYHKFSIYCKIFIFKKLIGYKYMKCGQKLSLGGSYTYPKGLPKYVGIEIFGVGEFGYVPKKSEIEENKDGQVITII